MEEIRRHPDGSVDCEFYALRAREHRSAHLRQTLSVARLASASPAARRGLKLLAAAFLVATGAFWATMITSPPTTEAGDGIRPDIAGTPVELFSVTLSRSAPDAPAGPRYDAH